MKNVALFFVVLAFAGCSDSDPWGKLDFLLLSPIIVVAFFLREWILSATKSKYENKTYQSSSAESIADDRPKIETPLHEKESVPEKKIENAEVQPEMPKVLEKQIKIQPDLEEEIDIFSHKVIANILSSCSISYYDLVGKESKIQDDNGYAEITRKRSILLAAYIELAKSCILIMPKEMPIDLKGLYAEIKSVLYDYLSKNINDSLLDEDLLFGLLEEIYTVNEETVSDMLPYIEDAVEYARTSFFAVTTSLIINRKELAYSVCKRVFELERPAPDNPHLLILEKDFENFFEFMARYMNKGCIDLARKYH